MAPPLTTVTGMAASVDHGHRLGRRVLGARDPAGGAHMAMIHEGGGGETEQGGVCSSCGAVLVPEEMTWVKPWRDARDRLQPVGTLA